MLVNYCTHVVVQLINSNCQPLKAVKDEPKLINIWKSLCISFILFASKLCCWVA